MSDETVETLTRVADDLKGIDLRTLRGQARESVKNARVQVGAALREVKVQKAAASV